MGTISWNTVVIVDYVTSLLVVIGTAIKISTRSTVVTDVNTNVRRVNVSVGEEKYRTKTRLGKNVENTVKDGFRVTGNNISTLRKTPGNWVEEPQGHSPTGCHQV